MDYFELLPHDKLVEFCESLNDMELSRLSIASKRVKDECQFILEERKIIHFKETADRLYELAEAAKFDSPSESRRLYIQFYEYLDKNYPLIRKVYNSKIVADIINAWIYDRYETNNIELERFRSLIEKLNRYFNLNYDLTRSLQITPYRTSKLTR